MVRWLMSLIIKYSSEIPSSQDQKGSSLTDTGSIKILGKKITISRNSFTKKTYHVCIKNNVFASFTTTLTFSSCIVPILKECQSRTLPCKSGEYFFRKLDSNVLNLNYNLIFEFL